MLLDIDGGLASDIVSDLARRIGGGIIRVPILACVRMAPSVWHKSVWVLLLGSEHDCSPNVVGMWDTAAVF